MKFEPAQDTYLEKAKKIEIDSLVEVAKEALDHKIECCMRTWIKTAKKPP